MKKLLILFAAFALLLAACGTVAQETTPGETTTRTTQADEVTGINIRPLLGLPFAEAQQFFGNLVQRHDEDMTASYEFDSGVTLNSYGWLENDDGTLVEALSSIWVGIDAVGFHFDGLTIGSTYDDVVAHFGFAGGRRDYDDTFSFSYLYTYADNTWGGFADEWGALGARFFFNEDHTVMAFQWFVPV
ncbi:MAG: hypothetical protein FWD06_07105 [Oscillospiraceae bacterium]|nr:hypothetical protein [Oscillospiraceae bacterium]